jgi:hypothetical protein
MILKKAISRKTTKKEILKWVVKIDLDNGRYMDGS